MTRRGTAIAALMVAGAMALTGAGILHSGQTKDTRPAVSDRSLAAELDVSGDKAVLVAALRRTDNEEAGSEMAAVML